MKKLVLIGLAIGLASVAVPNAVAKPTGLSAAELRALQINHERVADNAKLQRAWGPRIVVSPVNPVDAPGNLADDFHFVGVNPPYGGLPMAPLASTPSGTTDFQWSDAGFGAAGILALLALAGATILGVRRYHSGHLRTS